MDTTDSENSDFNSGVSDDYDASPVVVVNDDKKDVYHGSNNIDIPLKYMSDIKSRRRTKKRTISASNVASTPTSESTESCINRDVDIQNGNHVVSLGEDRSESGMIIIMSEAKKLKPMVRSSTRIVINLDDGDESHTVGPIFDTDEVTCKGYTNDDVMTNELVDLAHDEAHSDVNSVASVTILSQEQPFGGTQSKTHRDTPTQQPANGAGVSSDGSHSADDVAVIQSGENSNKRSSAGVSSAVAENTPIQVHPDKRESSRLGLAVVSNPEYRECSICFDDRCLPETGLECVPAANRIASRRQQSHFLCKLCLRLHVRTCCADGYVGRCYTDTHEVTCPSEDCESPPYTHKGLAHFLTDTQYDKYMAGMLRAKEVKLAKAMAADMKKREQLSQREGQVRKHVRYVEEEIINLRCPNPSCKQVFVDFNGCFALFCHRCKTGFCAFCLEHCGRDAHAHVAMCKYNINKGQPYGKIEVFYRAQRQRRERLLNAYVANVTPLRLRKQVIEALREQVKDVGIHLRGLKPMKPKKCVSSNGPIVL
eukprot:CFRG4443T1